MDTQPHAPSTLHHLHNRATEHWVEPLDDGTHILIRPLEARDREREFAFISNLSPQSRHFRFLGAVKEPSVPMLNQLMDVDYRQRMAYVALIMEDGQLIEIGVARYAAQEGERTCESAVVVADQWQHRGLGRRLMNHLIDAARRNGFDCMMSVDSSANAPMRRLAAELGFECRTDPLDAAQVIYRLQLE